VTENWRLAEVTEAAERMEIIPPLSRESRGKAQGSTFSVVLLCVPLSLCGTDFGLILATQSSFFATSSFTS
jgi:hypothetical protein